MLDDLAFVLRRDLVHQLHRFDDAEHLILLHLLADLDERRGARFGRAVEGADNRRLDDCELEWGIVAVGAGESGEATGTGADEGGAA